MPINKPLDQEDVISMLLNDFQAIMKDKMLQFTVNSKEFKEIICSKAKQNDKRQIMDIHRQYDKLKYL